MWFTIILSIIFFATLAMMVMEGLWSNLITLGQVLLCGLLAFGIYQPITIWADERFEGSYTYYLDIVVLWGVYAVAMVVVKALCGLLSRTKLRFVHPMDSIGGPLFAAVTAFFMAGFVGATLHTSPLAKETLSAGMVHDDVDGASSLTNPDIAWLRLVETASGAGLLGGQQFSPADYVAIYSDHREKFEGTQGFRVRRTKQ